MRDEDALESALARPRQRWSYEPESDTCDLAAAYGFGLARNHPYHDGNKRISFVATDNYGGGVMAAEKLNELLGGKGNICVMGTMAGGGSTMFRENGFLETMKKLGATGAGKYIKAIKKPAAATGK